MTVGLRFDIRRCLRQIEWFLHSLSFCFAIMERMMRQTNLSRPEYCHRTAVPLSQNEKRNDKKPFDPLYVCLSATFFRGCQMMSQEKDSKVSIPLARKMLLSCMD